MRFGIITVAVEASLPKETMIDFAHYDWPFGALKLTADWNCVFDSRVK